jgi:adenylate kinase family enzyme
MVDKRLTVYLESTVPLAAYYRQSCRLVEVDGNRAEDEVTASLVAAIAGSTAPAPNGAC